MKIARMFWIATLAIFISVSPRTQAQMPSPDALRAATSLTSLVTPAVLSEAGAQVMNQTWPTIEGALRNQYPGLDADTLAELRQVLERVQNAYATDFIKESPAIYARYFTADELRDMLAFYRSPTGAKALKVMPQITAEMMAAILQKAESVQTETSQAFDMILRRRGYIR